MVVQNIHILELGIGFLAINTLVIQWGKYYYSGTSNLYSNAAQFPLANFPISFKNQCCSVLRTLFNSHMDCDTRYLYIYNKSISGYYSAHLAKSYDHYIAIGY